MNTKPMTDVTKGRSQQSSTMPTPMGIGCCGMKANYTPPSNMWHTLLKSQRSSGDPPTWHCPPGHWSPTVQYLPRTSLNKERTLCVAIRDQQSAVQPTVTHLPNLTNRICLLITQLSASRHLIGQTGSSSQPIRSKLHIAAEHHQRVYVNPPSLPHNHIALSATCNFETSGMSGPFSRPLITLSRKNTRCNRKPFLACIFTMETFKGNNNNNMHALPRDSVLPLKCSSLNSSTFFSLWSGCDITGTVSHTFTETYTLNVFVNTCSLFSPVPTHPLNWVIIFWPGICTADRAFMQISSRQIFKAAVVLSRSVGISAGVKHLSTLSSKCI